MGETSETALRVPASPVPPPVEFSIVRRGYDRVQVDAVLAELRQAVVDASWAGDELAAGRRRLVQEREAFAQRVRDWKPSFSSFSAHIDAMARQLEAEADASSERTRRAEQQALGVIAERRHLDEVALAEQRRTAQLEAQGMLAAARAKAEEMLTAARTEATNLVAAAHDEVGRLSRIQQSLSSELNRTHDRLGSVVSNLPPTGTSGSR